MVLLDSPDLASYGLLMSCVRASRLVGIAIQLT